MPLKGFGNAGFWKRRKLIVLNAGNNLLPPAFTFVLSFLVVRTTSLDLWGEYVKLILFLTILLQLIAWGNKEYLLVEFSKTPGRLLALWKESTVVRSVLLIPCLAAILLSSYDFSVQCLLLLMLLFRFIYQSYDAFILYERKYAWKITAEVVAGIVFVGAVFLFHHELTFFNLLWLTLATDALKMLLLLVFMKEHPLSNAAVFRWRYLKRSFLFFLLTFTGLFISRIDQVLTTFLLPLRDVGTYQVMISFLLIIQSSCIFIVQPFLKNIYRLPLSTIHKISWNVGGIGCLLNSLWLFVFYELLLHVYGIQLSIPLMVASYLFTVPIFFYTVYIFYLLKTHRVTVVIAMNVAGGLCILLFSYIGMFLYGKSIVVVLWSAVLSQVLLAIGYYLGSRNRRGIFKRSSIEMLCLLTLLFTGCTNKPKTIKLLFTGDLLLDRGVRKTIESKGIDYVFEGVKPLLLQQDVVIANFEGTACDSGLIASSKQFCFRANPAWMAKLLENGINTVSLANNHSGDYGKEGLRQTAQYLRDHRIMTLGYQKTGDPCAPYLLEKNGIKLAFFASSFLYEKEPTGICHESDSTWCKRINVFEKDHPDYLIIMCLHWGIEMQLIPEANQVKQAHRLIDAGADLIIGHHPHVVQPVEKYKDRYILYSLGNFIFDNAQSPANKGILGCFSVQENQIILDQIIPFTLLKTKPVLMKKEEADSFVNSLNRLSN